MELSMLSNREIGHAKQILDNLISEAFECKTYNKKEIGVRVYKRISRGSAYYIVCWLIAKGYAVTQADYDVSKSELKLNLNV